MTPRIEKTVFISYRRTNVPWALAIYQNLTMHGYDVFFDYQSIDSGNFENIILGNIKTRAHFLVILTPSALERCKEPGDWLRREIETAMDEKRNIIPLMLESFDFGSPLVTDALTGKLSKLKKSNGLRVYSEYFFEAMDKLRERYLNVAVSDIALPTLNLEAKEITETQKTAASEAAPVEKDELTAQEWFERGVVLQKDNNLDEAIRCYSEAIKLEPNLVEAFINRGLAQKDKKDLDSAIADWSEAINLQPDIDLGNAYNNRGSARSVKGDIEGAIEDYKLAISYGYAGEEYLPYYNLGIALIEKAELDSAISNLNTAISINPKHAESYHARGLAHNLNHILTNGMEDGLEDFTEAIRLKPNYAIVYYNRALIWDKRKDYSSAITDYQKYLDLDGGMKNENQEEVEEKIKKLKSRLAKKKSARKKKSN